MRVLSDTGRGTWLAERAGVWATVGGVAGEGFEAYARILHPVEAWREAPRARLRWSVAQRVEETTWAWAEIASRNGRVMHPLVQFRRLTDNETRTRFAGRWRIGQSPEGWLDPALLSLLTARLETSTPDDVVVGIWEGWGLPSEAVPYTMSVRDDTTTSDEGISDADIAPHDAEAAASVSAEFRAAIERGPLMEFPDRRYVPLQTSLGELSDPRWGFGAGIGWMNGRQEPTAQLIWPEDHAWVVASEIDWDSTIVAGSRSIVDAILADPAFEVFEVRATDALHWDGDLINPDRMPTAD